MWAASGLDFDMTKVIEIDIAESTSFIVLFHCWGQACTTEFAELGAALNWVEICYEKNFIAPDEITDSNGVTLMDNTEIVRRISS